MSKAHCTGDLPKARAGRGTGSADLSCWFTTWLSWASTSGSSRTIPNHFGESF